MDSIDEMNKRVSTKLGDKLTTFCSPLVVHLGINHFYHFVLTDSGQCAAVGLNQAWQEYLHSHEQIYPSFTNFYHNRDDLKGILFCQTIPNKSWQDLVKEGVERFKVYIGLQVTKRTSLGIEGFGFGFNTNDPSLHMALLNELPLLHFFIDEYKRQFPIKTLKDNFVDLPSVVGPSFFSPKKQEAPKLRNLILGKMKVKIENSFTKRELEVIQQLLTGSPSASQIADSLYLSKRTVEDHLDHLKDKLDCRSKHELILKLQQLESYGFLF